ncbi:L,D-transpeptidase family protein [Streptomyces sp. H27-D2]|nr:L,D-transpeptidase family protein [Streptomyces sp. H27-D2]MEC4020499.1 L,D-transpeptidase family protein [Streptomyces sp. H27-D2]
MRTSRNWTRAAAATAGLALLAACGSTSGDDDGGGNGSAKRDGSGKQAVRDASPAAELKHIPGVGEKLRAGIPANARQVVAVYGKGADSADAAVSLFTKDGSGWKRTKNWTGHNGKRGWTPDHREGDKRSPVGVFTLSDAGGVLADPGAKLPYQQSAAFAAPHYWAKSHWNDFDYVVAIDYNRVKGTPPNDPTRPQGQSKGGSIWLHMDHGSGTSGCVSLPKSGMEYLLKTLDPKQHPVVVMGDKAHLAA